MRVVVGGDHRGLREALACALARHDGLVASAGPLDPGFTSDAGAGRPDVAVLAATGSVRRVVEVCAKIKERSPAPRTVVVGPGGDDSALLDAIRCGADGYVGCDEPVDALAETVRSVHHGEARIPPGMLGTLLASLIHDRREQDAASARFATLSAREQEVLALMADGLDSRGVAERLYVSAHTVRTHAQNIFAKLDVHSRLEAVAFVLDHDLLSEVAGRAGPTGIGGGSNV